MNLENLRHQDTLTKSEIEQLWLQGTVRRAEEMDKGLVSI